MLVTPLEQLRTLASERRYEEASCLIDAVEELAGHFRELGHVNRVADLLERKASVLGDLKQQLLDDYASLLGGPSSADLPDAWGIDAARCVDALGPSMQREVVTQFCLAVLEDYKDIFQPPKEASGLEVAERRFYWLKRKIGEYNEKHAASFPEAWRVPCGLCMHFCHVTRQHLVEILSTSHHTVDPELMVRVLRKSIDFENELARKYNAEDALQAPAKEEPPDTSAGAAGFGLKYPDVLGQPRRAAERAAAEGGADFAPRFRGIISECFDAYLSSWVQHEEKQLLEVLDRSTAPGADKMVGNEDDKYEEEDDAGFEPKYLYSSAPSLFASMKGSMTKCAGFSTHNTLFDIFQVFRKVLARYCDRLAGLLGAPAAPLDAAAVQAVCCVIGTAEYCDETLPQLAQSLQRVISSEFEDRVTFGHEQELFGNLMNRANQTLVQSVSCSLDEAFGKMTRTKWATFCQDVGDHSAYVGDISERLSKQFGPIAANLSKIHYRFFCDKFVQAFVARFISEIYKCGKISEQGAQQLLLDTALIKTTLLEAPVIAGKGRPMQTAYSNYVLREMGRAETMLKVLSSPDLVDASAVSALLGSDGASPESAAEIERLLALRAGSDGGEGLLGSPRDDERYGGSGVAALGSTMMNLGDALNQQSAKASQDLKKLSGDMKKNLQKLGSLGVNLPGITGRKPTAGSSSAAP
mmetsp:Transcript_56494/g.170913  ORF Transcript_56494/g.170913 Transcript_56494/m.170913 type:complete len:696 (-) Transcript_56494:13-2100(-)